MLEQLGRAAIPLDRLEQLVRSALSPYAVLDRASVRVVDVPYDWATPTTGGVWRVQGRARVAECDDVRELPFSFVVKVVRSATAWPGIVSIPEPARAGFSRIPWRLEIDARRPEFAALLPEGLRQPAAYLIDEIADDHASIWLEDVPVARRRWAVGDFARAAYLLGQFAASRPVGHPVALSASTLSRTPGVALRYYTEQRVLVQAAASISDPSAWTDPVAAEALGEEGETDRLRADLVSGLEQVLTWLDLAESLPQYFQHGDASPQNLLIPAADDGTFVVIDWGFNGPLAIGFDLGQLLIGLAHAGELEAHELGPVRDVIEPAYLSGARDAGADVTADQVRCGFITGVLCRSAFTALPLVRLTKPARDGRAAVAPVAEQVAHWRSRIRLTRYLLGLGAELSGRALPIASPGD